MLSQQDQENVQVHDEKVNSNKHIIRKINKQSNANVKFVNLNLLFLFVV